MKLKKIMKRTLTLVLTLALALSMVSMSAFADNTNATAMSTSTESDDYERILHLDCGRKYFTKEWIIALTNEMAAAGYTHLQLAFGNDGLRFLLDDMSVTVDGTTYSSENVAAGIHAGNEAYYNDTVDELTQSEMDEIIAHAKSVGIEIIPHLNMPGHMDAILDAIEYVGISDAHFTGYTTSVRSLNLSNESAVSFAKALLEKYVAYFDAKGCTYFHIGADEFANDAYYGGMGFPNMGSTLYTKFASYVNDCAAIVENAGMTARAWNDGISYGTYSDSFDTDIQITYWSSGWSGYNVASASTLASKGHDMINTHGDYYFILSSSGITNPSDSALNFNNTTFAGSTVSDPVGSMFCIWCDVPGSATETQVAEAARITLRKMAAAMQGTTTYSEDIVAGGFNEDGTINDDEVSVPITKTDEESNVSVTADNLTGLTVTEVKDADLPEIEDAVSVRAWDMTPVTEDGNYTGSADVSVPVPEDWTTNLVRGFYIENGAAMRVNGTYADGYYTFEMPHFSVGGIMLLDASTAYNVQIDLTVDGAETVTIDGVNLSGQPITPDPAGIATVDVEGKEAVTGTTVSTTKATTLENGATYIIRVYDTNYALTSNQGATTWKDSDGTTRAFENYSGAESDNMWTVEATDGGYKLKSAAGYLNLGYNAAWITTTGGDTFTLTYSSSGWTISDGTYNIDALGGLTAYYCAGGWANSGTRFDLYKVTEATEASTDVTFTGVSAGTTYVTINDVVYKIVVHGETPITINYALADGTVIKSETVNVLDNATTYTVSNFNDNGKYYVADNITLNITPATQTVYTVTVTETEEDLSQVTSLTIEYWQTNGRVTAPELTSDENLIISAERAYSEDGIALLTVIPQSGYKNTAKVNYWRSRLLLRSSNEQTESNGDDETLNGTGFTKVRYWNGSWAVYTDADVWQNIDPTVYQLAAYYMNDMDLADEVNVGTSDWGRKGDGSMDDQYLGQYHVSVAFQVVYEDGTTYPAGTTAELLKANTYFVDAWGWESNDVSRGVGTISLNQVGDYQIWKVTAETGGNSTSFDGWDSNLGVQNFSYNSVTWDNNEMTVWADKDNPVSQYTILNPAGEPSTSGAYANLMWNEVDEAILIRIYLKTVETEDSLKVVYYDEKFNTTLEEFNISVPTGSNFNESIVDATTGAGATLPDFTGNAERDDATGYGIVNVEDKIQKFETDLTKVAITNNRYSADLYKYTGSVISEDGKTITHYYSINQGALSPNFVADFGLPLTFNLSDVVKDGINTVKSVTVTPETKFGTLSYNSQTQVFTYTPTHILTTIDVLTISILFDGETTATTTNVGVTPATTVHYEESFISWVNGWTGGTTKPTMTQNAAVLGEDSNNYGYDPAYATVTGASNNTNATTSTIGATGTFTFTGNGVQVFANATEGSGYVSVQVKNSSGSIVNMAMVDTIVDEGEKDVTFGQSGDLYGLPIVSLVDLQNMPHDTYTVTLTKIMDTEPVYIDGIRVFNTMEDSTIFVKDLEDNPDFYELRDTVLYAVGTGDSTTDTTTESTSVDYKTMYEQVYDAIEGATALITDESVTYADSSTLQDLLDNGPKNEIYLYAGQTLKFKVSTKRVMQVGMKAPQGETTATISVDGGENTTDTSIDSSVDMFYTLASKTENETAYEVEIKNTGEKILSVTLLKICDDPDASFVSFTEEDVEDILAAMGFEPAPVYADATLNIAVNDADGNALATTQLTANGIEGEEATFVAADIQAAVATLELPDNYNLDDVTYSDVTVTYGSEDSVAFTAEKELTQEEKVVETVKQIFSSISNFFKKFFRW